MVNKTCSPLLKIVLILILTSLTNTINSQPVKTYDASEIRLALKKLSTLGSILYIGAHPDDENTAFLSYCVSEKSLRTGYLSLTRGDGGQNLIGDEQSELLGVIRTQELLQARKHDGAEQFFSRAVDFGYTKSPEETFKFWDKEKLLSDVVWVIRKFRPDVIVTRFPTTGEGGHGQHTASAILAVEAFSLAGDPNAFPEQLKYVSTWSPKRIFWNAWTRALNYIGINPDTLININLGSYNEIFGKSYTEISAESRSMHKSQGFGDSGYRGNYLNYFVQLDGEPAKGDLFSGIDITWNRIKNSSEINSLLKKAYDEFDDENPSGIIPLLIDAYKLVNNLPDDFWSQIKSREMLNLIRACAGIWIEAISKERIYTLGSEFIVSTGIVNRSDFPFKLEGIHITDQVEDSSYEKVLEKGEFITFDKKIHLGDNTKISQPYWLIDDRTSEIFNVSDQTLIGTLENSPPLIAHFILSSADAKLVFSCPVLFREESPTQGEVYNPLVVAPPVTINFENNLYLFTSDQNKELLVTVKNYAENSSGELKLNLPQNWKVEPSEIDFSFSAKFEEKQFVFKVIPPKDAVQGHVTAGTVINGKSYKRSTVTINYEHIPLQTVFPTAKAKLVRLDVGNHVVNKIGYINGSGDKVPEYLRELGFDVTILSDEDLSNGNISRYDVVIAGIRVYNTNDRIKIYQKNIRNYIENGGTYIVQYSTTGNLITEPGPYDLTISHDRVTEEDADVKIIDPDNPIFNFPNKITQRDFEGWIQERGLYFPDKWDSHYKPLLEMKDTGESPKLGSLLYTKYGKGVFVYTGLSFFRELPAGVPGAYRLFVNLISAGKYAQ